jgi:N-acetylmuramoyl-L-alanine amidase CwlA
MPEIKQMLIPVSNKVTRPGIKRKPRHITIHETGNTNKGANALVHARLQARGNERGASWHYQVDDSPVIYQSVPDEEVAWAAGDGKGEGNMGGIQIEICVNSGGDFSKAVAHTAWLVRHLMKKHNLEVEHVVQHNNWSGKNCPQRLRSGSHSISWGTFIGMIREVPIAKPPTKEEDEVFNSGSSTLNKEVVETIVAARQAGILKSDTYVNKAKNGTLTLQELTAITTLIVKRAYLDNLGK